MRREQSPIWIRVGTRAGPKAIHGVALHFRRLISASPNGTWGMQGLRALSRCNTRSVHFGRIALIAVVLGALLTACGDTAGTASASRAAGIATCHTFIQYEMHFATSDLAENYLAHPRLGAHLVQVISSQSASSHDQKLIAGARALAATLRTPAAYGQVAAIFHLFGRCKSYGFRYRTFAVTGGYVPVH
jgi:hypothetical protein